MSSSSPQAWPGQCYSNSTARDTEGLRKVYLSKVSNPEGGKPGFGLSPYSGPVSRENFPGAGESGTFLPFKIYSVNFSFFTEWHRE